MNRWRAGLVLVFAVFGSHCHQAPASTKNYEVGSLYIYDYILGLELNEPNPGAPSSQTNPDIKTGSTVGYKILSQVQVRSVWQNEPGGSILEIQLVKPQLQIKSRKAPQPEGFRDHSSQLDSATLHPLYVHWKDGQIQKTFTVEDDDISLVNIKKGIANLLQYRNADGDITENTPRGKCKVNYKTKNSHQMVRTVSGNCETAEASVPFPFKAHNSKVLGSEIQSEIKADIKLTREGSIVEDAEVTETHVVRVTVRQEVGANVKGSQSFKLSGSSTSKEKIVKASTAEAAIKEIAKTRGFQLTLDSLMPKQEKIPACEAPNCKSFDVLTRVLTSDNMATSKMSSAFIQLVQKFREASLEELKKIVKPNFSIFHQLLDVCSAAGTLITHKVAMSTLKFNSEEEIESPERYLIGLSLSPSPVKEILDDLFNRMKKKVPSEKLQETLTLTVAALVHTLRENAKKTSQDATLIGLDVEDHLLNSLKSCSGDNESACQQLYLRSLKNIKSRKTVPVLFEIVQTAEQRVSLVAMKAIHALPDSYIELKYRPVLLKIVRQLGRKYDSSVRTLAIDLILRNSPSKEEIDELFQLLTKVSDSQHAEVATFMWNRVHEFMETNKQLESYIWDIISDNKFNTYHHLAPRGLSTAFTRILTESPSGNGSFSNAIEMSGKILKRSSFDVYISSKEESLQLLSLGIFAGGLSSFASSSDDEQVNEVDSEDATAGMELTLMGVQMRPIVFFVGKSELMSLVWSGAGSERTTAVQGNVLLQDERQVIPLFNGLVADVNIQGGLSFDLAGQVQLSLWHRTANSLVENRAGLFLQSVVRADTSFVRSRVDYTVATESTLHFTSDINFYDGVLMCLKLVQPEFKIRQNIHKTERIPGSKHKLRKAKYKTSRITGITYALNKKNSQLCGVMYKDEL